MQVQPVQPGDSVRALLPGASFADAYSLTVAEPLDAMTAARRAFERTPAWIGALMALRNRAVAPLGLKTVASETLDASKMIGFFPLISATPDRVVAGLDDRHLDFRVALDTVPLGGGRTQVTAATVVRTRNRWGRLYLAAVLPFHRVIVPAMLRQAAKP